MSGNQLTSRFKIFDHIFSSNLTFRLQQAFEITSLQPDGDSDHRLKVSFELKIVSNVLNLDASW